MLHRRPRNMAPLPTCSSSRGRRSRRPLMWLRRLGPGLAPSAAFADIAYRGLIFGQTAVMGLEWLRKRGAKRGVARGMVFRSKSWAPALVAFALLGVLAGCVQRRVGRLDLMRRRATIAESVTLVRGVQTWGTPKGHERREVPIPRFLVDDLAAHVAGRDPGRWCSPQ